MHDNTIRININETTSQLGAVINQVGGLIRNPVVKLFLSLKYEQQKSVRQLFNGDYWGSASDLYSLRQIDERLTQLHRLIKMLDQDTPAVPQQLAEEIALATMGRFDVTYPGPQVGAVCRKRVDVLRLCWDDWQNLMMANLLSVAPDEVRTYVSNMGRKAAGKAHPRACPFDRATGMDGARQAWADMWLAGYDQAMAEGYVHPSMVENPAVQRHTLATGRVVMTRTPKG